MDSKGENKSIKILVVSTVYRVICRYCVRQVSWDILNYDMNRKLNEKKQDVDKQVCCKQNRNWQNFRHRADDQMEQSIAGKKV